jgi:hypothetical protein
MHKALATLLMTPPARGAPRGSSTAAQQEAEHVKVSETDETQGQQL